MICMLVRVLLAAGSGAAALLVDPGAPDFPVVQGMLALAALVVALTAATVLQLAAAWFPKRRVSPRSRLWAP